MRYILNYKALHAGRPSFHIYMRSTKESTGASVTSMNVCVAYCW